jgi:hypothetical protein
MELEAEQYIELCQGIQMTTIFEGAYSDEAN